MNELNRVTVYLESLGCSKNLVDSEVMVGLLEEAGCIMTSNPAQAQIIIVNTCGFIADAQQESINTILHLAGYREKGPARLLVVAGCLPQRFAPELGKEILEIDVMVGTGEFHRIVDLIKESLDSKKVTRTAPPVFLYDHTWPRRLITPAHYAYIKVAEGCDNRCSYCTIPDIRGRFRSREADSILAEAERLAADGVKEIILIAQDTSRYGEDISGRPQLAMLLRRLCAIPEIHWVRWLYGYPTRITDELVQVMAEEPKICPYIDLPLQHAAAGILKRMHRPADPRATRRLLKKLKERIPRLALRTSFIVGFPGETEDDFKTLLDFVEEVEFDWLGAFTYSRETGTVAAKLEGEVAEAVKEERFHRLMQKQQLISLRCNQRWVGRTTTVLVEGFRDGLAFGRSQREAPEIDGLVYFRPLPRQQPSIGDMVKVKIESADYYDRLGVATK